MNKTCALYLKADPLMKKDVQTVKKILRIYPSVAIILDRKWQTDRYLLSFTERADILNHEFRQEGITEYRILANDTSKYDSFVKEGIQNIAVQLTNFSKMDEICERYRMLNMMNPNVNVIMIPQFGDDTVISNKVLQDMIMEDDTHSLHKRYISDFAYIKTKLNLMRKIGLTGNRGSGLGIVLDVFREREYQVIDLDQMIMESLKDETVVRKLHKTLVEKGIRLKGEVSATAVRFSADKDKLLKLCLKDEFAKETCVKFFYDCLYMKLAQVILKSNRKVVVISSTLLFEFKMDWMFDDIITVTASEENQIDRMKNIRGYDKAKIDDIMRLHMPISEKVKRSGMFIDSNEGKDALVRNTVNLINYRIERGF